MFDILVSYLDEVQFTHPGRGATVQWLIDQYKLPTFQFTHPGRSATDGDRYTIAIERVSIHAPREGCD